MLFVLRLDHVVHGKISGSLCICTTRLVHGGVANALSSLLSSPKNNARLAAMMLEVLAFLLDKKCGEQSGDDGRDTRTWKFRNS